jgi:P-type Ca2+ transporter type 2C
MGLGGETMQDRLKSELDVTQLTGLSNQEAANHLKEQGYNELPTSKPRSILAMALEVIREPMFLLLIASGAIYLVLGDVEEALILLSFVFVIIAITVYQEHKTERALEALRDLSSPRALVMRSGQQKRIPGREVVPDDIVLVAEGDRVPADGLLLWNTGIEVDESLLTGESVTVRKNVWDGVMETSRPGGDDLPFVYSGTLLVKGQGAARITATGVQTEIGKIGKALSSLETERTPLQRETGRLVRQLAIVGITLCVLVVIAYGLTRGDWLQGTLAGITLAMAMLPEEFPVVLTIFLALGAWRISQKRVLTRRVPAVETLGATTVLCVDKTGTLTQNRMRVGKIFADNQFYDVSNHDAAPLPETFHEIVEFSILASQRDPFDPMEIAFKEFGNRYLAGTEHLHADWVLERQYPLSTGLLALSHVWQSPEGGNYIIAAKGAPEAIADLCHFDKAQMQALEQSINQMASAGLRVLGMAKAYFKHGHLPEGQHDFNFKFLGLVGLADPVRPTVPAALKECYQAGIRVVMITGDYPMTAQSIAREIGLKSLEQVITGPELDAMDDAELQRRIQTVNIFARVIPEQKLRLVKALKANGEIVAMTGDGVNDAPALKAAHIGIAMGGRGTDVAREAAALVLLDDDFSSIVEAVRSGRRIFDNLQKAMAYILAVHVPIAGLSLLPVLFKWPLILMPVHVVFLELIIDPACSIVFEAEIDESDVMKRPPRDPDQPLFGKPMIILSLLQGLGVLLITLTVYLLDGKQGEMDARTMTFATLIIANLGLILANRSWSRTILATLRSPNRALWWVVGGSLLFLGLVLFIPFLRELFSFAEIHLVDIGICVAGGIVSILWFEGFKRFRHPARQVQ